MQCKINSDRSEGLTVESTEDVSLILDSSGLKPAQNDEHMEQGRSMVEMLGTLAIMGVLSVGAIAGFNYAMNKHRANELLDEARKRAYTVMTQTQLGLTRSLSEYSRYNTFAGGPFASEIVTENLSGQFGLKITGVLGRVCDRFKEVVSSNTIIRKLFVNGIKAGTCTPADNTLLLVYNNDMGIIDPPACHALGWENNQGHCTCRPGYSGDTCQISSCPTGQMYCGMNGTTPVCCEAGSICTTAGNKVTGTCYKNTNAAGCTTNDDCQTAAKCSAGAGNCYCALEGNCTSVSSITSGSCQPIGGASSTDVTGIGTVVKSNTKMTWWSARNWCAAKGMKLLDISGNRLGCSDATLGTSAAGFCCARGTSCETDKALQSQAMQDLRNKWPQAWCWTATDRSIYAQCSAFDVNLYEGNFYYSRNRKDKGYALCAK